MAVIKNGLLPHREDKNDYKLGHLFQAPLNVPMVDFLVGNPDVLDQGETQACTAFATCVASGVQEKADLSPEYTFMKSHYLMGDETDGGVELRVACKTHTKFGALDRQHSPFTFEEKGSEFIANWTNWDSVNDINASFYRKKAYLSVE